jgi:steroid 5-alpha reductase family enzyme
MMVMLAALGWLVAALAMTALWAWQRRSRGADITAAIWPALVGGLAVLYANLGDGEWARRSAMAWMMGSWGARLAVQGIYARAAHQVDHAEGSRPFWFYQMLAVAAAVASLPALLASLDSDPKLSTAEMNACALWVVGFAGETTADRQRLRFRSIPGNRNLPCRVGLWRYSRHVDRIFEGVIWIAYATFAMTAVSAMPPQLARCVLQTQLSEWLSFDGIAHPRQAASSAQETAVLGVNQFCKHCCGPRGDVRVGGPDVVRGPAAADHPLARGATRQRC